VYYSADGKSFSNRTDAIRYQQKTKTQVFFYYYDDVYSKLDWTIEPPESLEFHYKTQAQKIRDEYDYVILCYSGGYDSTNILETFHYNNILLDKIVVTGPFKQDLYNESDENHNKEIYKNAFPYLYSLGLNSRVQAFDHTELYNNMNNFSIFTFGDNWIDEIGSRYSPHHFFWRDLSKHVVPKEYENKKVGIIWGTDKPGIFFNNNHMTFKFRDGPITSYGRFNQPLYSNVTNINFYWDHTYPQILLKQLHTLRKTPSYFANEKKVHEIIYPFKRPLIYKGPKSPSPLIGIRDGFLMGKNSDILNFYNNGIEKLKDLDIKLLGNVPTKEYIIK
jgi:hypothetical protein